MKKTFNGFIKIVSFIGILLLLLMVDRAFPFGMEGCASDRKKCHNLDEKEASKILKGFNIKFRKHWSIV